jgi:hypothetical protein
VAHNLVLLNGGDRYATSTDVLARRLPEILVNLSKHLDVGETFFDQGVSGRNGCLSFINLKLEAQKVVRVRGSWDYGNFSDSQRFQRPCPSSVLLGFSLVTNSRVVNPARDLFALFLCPLVRNIGPWTASPVCS